MPSKSPPWRREEIVLALDLYIRSGRRVLSDTDAPVIALSHDLNQLPLIPAELRAHNFRNPGGVALKLANLRSFDPTSTSKGMSAGSRLDGEIFAELADDPAALSAEVRAIRATYRAWLEPESASDEQPHVREPRPPRPLRPTLEDNRPTRLVAESQAQWSTRFDPIALHLELERDMDAQRQRRDEAGSSTCEVCGFDFSRTYGALGEGYIQFHHRTPVAELHTGTRPTAADLHLVCANCHAMLHAGEKPLTVAELKVIVREQHRSGIRDLASRVRSPESAS
jgi:5-methylcytosine-specific restriction protein A